MLQPFIKLDGRKFVGFSRRYVEGFALVTYVVEDTTSTIYVDPNISQNEILSFVRYEFEGLEHLVSSVFRWGPTKSIIETQLGPARQTTL